MVGSSDRPAEAPRLTDSHHSSMSRKIDIRISNTISIIFLFIVFYKQKCHPCFHFSSSNIFKLILLS
ncbi:unnamed protein product [Amoebophrya sp. A25]|nr:unnamed protein product [Amoebophrya sp. A25]|eukprot:GSA25T00022020001.1